MTESRKPSVPENNKVENNKFDGLTFEDFRALAADTSLSRHEKVGFPDSYREGQEELIYDDVLRKLPALGERGKTVLEIGPGCSLLPELLSKTCKQNDHHLIFIDSAEMLVHLPDEPHITKVPGAFPLGADFFETYRGKVDSIIAYSVIQYAFAEGNIFDFLDKALMLLCDGGEILLGDIPNISMRKRFFASNEGQRTHRAYTGQETPPDVAFNCPEPGLMDDTVVMALLSRARLQGFHAWVVPQDRQLPMANRREDILIRRP